MNFKRFFQNVSFFMNINSFKHLNDKELWEKHNICFITAELVIIYVRDPESREMADGCLFNQIIYCATSQAELRVYSEKDRFLSMFDSLKKHQIQHLVNIVNTGLWHVIVISHVGSW